MNKKNKKNYFVKVFFLFFIFFIIIYLSNEVGYYDYKAYNKSKLTKDAIVRFENDVKEGKDVSVNDYIEQTSVNYENVFSETGNEIGILLENFMNSKLKETFDILKKLFYE